MMRASTPSMGLAAVWCTGPSAGAFVVRAALGMVAAAPAPLSDLALVPADGCSGLDGAAATMWISRAERPFRAGTISTWAPVERRESLIPSDPMNLVPRVTANVL